MKRAVLAIALLVSACKTPPAPPAPRLAPGKDSTRAFRELSARAAKAPADEAGRLTLELARRRLALMALADASEREDLLIAAGSAAEALGPCVGVRSQECDAAITAKVRADLVEAERDGQKKETEPYWQLLDAMEGAARGETAGLTALAALAQQDGSFIGQVAALYALSRLSLAWAGAARGPAALAAPRVGAVAALVCPNKACPAPSSSLAPLDSEANRPLLAALDLAHNLISSLEAAKGEVGEAARSYALKPLRETLARPVPLAPLLDAQAQALPVWRECTLAFPTPEGADPLDPREILSLDQGTLRLSMAPAVRLDPGGPARVESSLGYAAPGKELGPVTSASLASTLTEALAASHQARASLGRQDAPSQSLALLVSPGTPAAELESLVRALSAAKITELHLLVRPKEPPKDPSTPVFGASIPLRIAAGGAVVAVAADASLSLHNTAPFPTLAALLAALDAGTAEQPALRPAPALPFSSLLSVWESLRARSSALSTAERAPLRLALD